MSDKNEFNIEPDDFYTFQRETDEEYHYYEQKSLEETLELGQRLDALEAEGWTIVDFPNTRMGREYSSKIVEDIESGEMPCVHPRKIIFEDTIYLFYLEKRKLKDLDED